MHKTKRRSAHDFKGDPKAEARKQRLAKAALTHPQPGDAPPHSIDAEQGALGCVLLAGGTAPKGELSIGGSMAEADSLLHQLRPSYFYDLRHATLFDALRFLRMENHAVDVITLHQWLKDKGQLEGVGGLPYIAGLADIPPSQWNFPYYLEILRDKAHRRWLLKKSVELTSLASAAEVTLEDTQSRLAELFDATHKTAGVPLIEVITPKQAREFVPDPADFLIGEGLIAREQFCTIGGEPGCGKSRLATTLAVALARGNATWQGYPVRCQARTLILQTENKGTRLKEEFAAVPPDLDDWIKVSKSLPHGLAFSNPDFRREVTRLHEKWPFELMVIDPWNDVCSEEGQGDYADALLSISACFRGRKMPAVVIVAHLRKPRQDASGRRKSGRELLHELSGSLKLGSTSRTVFAVQPASYDMSDDRLVFEVAKANDCAPEWLKEYGTRSAWHRRNGAFESCRDFDWEGWMNPGGNNAEKRSVSLQMLQSAMTGRAGMKAGELVRAVADQFEVGESTVWRAIGRDGYARKWLDEAAGVVALKEQFR